LYVNFSYIFRGSYIGGEGFSRGEGFWVGNSRKVEGVSERDDERDNLVGWITGIL